MAVLLPHTSSHRRSVILFGCVWFLAFMAPVVFMPNHVARRYASLPMIGLVMAGSALTETYSNAWADPGRAPSQVRRGRRRHVAFFESGDRGLLDRTQEAAIPESQWACAATPKRDQGS